MQQKWIEKSKKNSENRLESEEMRFSEFFLQASAYFQLEPYCRYFRYFASIFVSN